MELIIVSSLPFSRLKTLKNINFVNLLNQIILASNIVRTRAHNFDRKRSNLFISIISGNFLFLALIFLLFIAKVHPSLPSNKNQVPVFAATLFFVLMENMLEIKWPNSIQTFDNSSSSISGKSLLYALMFIPQGTANLLFLPWCSSLMGPKNILFTLWCSSLVAPSSQTPWSTQIHAPGDIPINSIALF